MMSEFYFIKNHLSAESGFTGSQQESLHRIFHDFSELVEDLQEEVQTLQDRVNLLEEA